MDKLKQLTQRQIAYGGILHFLMAWGVYTIVECFFSAILPWIVWPNSKFRMVSQGFTAILFVLYPTIGLIFGCLLGAALPMALRRVRFLQELKSATFFSSAATFSLVFVFSLNLCVQFHATFSSLPLGILAVSILLMLGLVLSNTTGIWAGRFSFLANPWTISIILLGMPWITKDLLKYGVYPVTVRSASALAFCLAVLSISFLFQKIQEKRRIDKAIATPTIPGRRSFTVLALLMMIVIGTSFSLNRIPTRKGALYASSSHDADRPNVILIVMDTARADHTSLYGYEKNTTPNLKKLSSKAILYTRAIASSDMTLSTHGSIFTGMYPRKHGAHHLDPLQPSLRHGGYSIALDYDFQTLAEILAVKGYLTFGIMANYGWLGPAFHLDQGFQYYDCRVPIWKTANGYYLRRGIYKVLNQSSSPFDASKSFRNAEDINREVFSILDEVKENDAPFFFFINYMDAHFPYIPPPPFDTLFPGKDESLTLERYINTRAEVMEQVMKLEKKLTERERQHLVSQYDGGIAYLDFHLGKLIARLKTLGLYENSLIIITSDHGEAFGKRGLIDHGVSAYQDQVHIPLIIKYPKYNESNVVDELVSTVDLMPTILDVVEIELPKEVQGQSLLRIESGNSREVLSESFPGQMVKWHPRYKRIQRAIFSGQYKFIRSTTGERELYDLSNDPEENHNLFNADDVVGRTLEKKLNVWLQQVEEKINVPVKLDKETLNRLRSLGYVK